MKQMLGLGEALLLFGGRRMGKPQRQLTFSKHRGLGLAFSLTEGVAHARSWSVQSNSSQSNSKNPGSYAGIFSCSATSVSGVTISGAVDMISSIRAKISTACSSRVLEGGKGEGITSDMGSSLGTSPRRMPFSSGITAFLRQSFLRRLGIRHN
jgi:hypothetical protein